MRWFARLLVFWLVLLAVVPEAEGGWFSRKRRGPKKKPAKVVKPTGPKVKIPITGLDVVGNENVSKEVILLAISTKLGDPFSEARLKKDVEAIKKLGYFSSLETDMAPFQGGVKVTFRVAENPIISKLAIQGNALIPTKRIKELLNIKVGSTLNLTQLQEGIKAVNKTYTDKGYAFCGILTNEQFSIDPRTHTLKIKIIEPKLRKLAVTGNRKTRTYVITREMMLKKGRLLKMDDIKRAMRDVHNLGFFEDVKPPTPKLDLKNQAIDLNFEVKEQKTGTASFGGGYSSVNGFIGFIDVSESNFRGKGQTIRGKYQFGGEQSYLFSFVEPWFMGRPVSLGGSVYQTRVEREQFVSGLNMNRFLEERGGFGITSGWRVSRDTRLSASFSDEHVKLDQNISSRGSIQAALPPDIAADDKNKDGIVEYDEQSFGLNWTKDKRDNYLQPRAGYRLSLGFSMTGGWLQGLNGFNKYVGDYRHYVPLKIFHGSTFAARVRGGHTQETDGALRFIDRYAVGGTDSIRGFQDREFTGADFMVANLEFRKDFSKMFGAALFFDIGDAWNSDGLSFDAKASYGAGMRITTPLGPFRLDYGIPTESGRTGRLHFGIGQSF
ncbi:MAG: BamA/TamA family outer membrane protein [Candidatus Riflebacteria bacterium]|nr:BamA/TamA family outer membrane protein [Candidatus Riflebacteria bacterium]